MCVLALCIGESYPNNQVYYFMLYEMAQETSWHFKCWLSRYTDDSAFFSFLGRGGCDRLSFWITADLPLKLPSQWWTTLSQLLLL